MTSRRPIPVNQPIGDEVKTSTCYMCACRCGIKVHLKDGRVRYIEGNPDHPVNRGVLCAKGSAGIMQHNSPARLTKPLKRVGERGKGEFQEIEWDEALDTVAGWLGAIRDDDPKKLAFFTGRDQSQALTGWWASQFGTPNYAAHGGFCSVNMAAAGIYTIGGSFWEFGEPDWERTQYLLMFGVAEDHDSNPIKMGLGKLKARGAKVVSVNPVRTGYSAIADEWIGIRPGRDGLFVMALIHHVLSKHRIDLDYLLRFTNAGWLVVEDPEAADHGLFARDGEGQPQVWHRLRQRALPHREAPMAAALHGAVTLEDGRQARPVLELLAERYLDPAYAPEAVADQCGVPAATIRRIGDELIAAAFDHEIAIDQPWTDWTGEHHSRMVGRPVSMHAMRGISAHSNGFHTCRALHLLQVLLGSIDAPGGFRYKAPFPRPAPPGPLPAGKPDQVRAGQPLPGPPLGFPQAPEDLLLDADGRPMRIDGAYSWEAPIAAHGMMHLVIRNAVDGDPYPIDTLFMYMANMAWNSAMNTAETMQRLAAKDEATGDYKIPHIVYSDAYYSETVAYADIVLPDTTYLERWDCVSLLDRPISEADGPADAIRQPVVEPDRDVRPFQSVLLDLGARLGLPGMTEPDGGPRYPGGYPDYLVNHERRPGIGSLAGWRGEGGTQHGEGAPNPDQLDRYIENGCFWHDRLADDQRFYKHGNAAYLKYAERMGFVATPDPVILQLYAEPLQRFRRAAEGHGPVQPPDDQRDWIARHFDPLPFWHPPHEDQATDEAAYPLHAITQRPMAMYHSWGSQNAWLRQIMARNVLYISHALADRHDLQDGDWAWLSSRNGRIKVEVRRMAGVNEQTVWTWNAIGKRAGAWNLKPDAPEATKGFLLNHLIDERLPADGYGHRRPVADPITGQAAWFDLRVSIEKAEGAEATEPRFDALPLPPGLPPSPEDVRYGADFSRHAQTARYLDVPVLGGGK